MILNLLLVSFVLQRISHVQGHQFTVTFSNNGSAVFEWDQREPAKPSSNLEGTQGFIRFAIVVEELKDGVFKNGDEVALKFTFAHAISELETEQGAHDFIRTNDPKGEIAVVRAEMFLAKCSAEELGSQLNAPKESITQTTYTMLVMERVGKDLETSSKEDGHLTETELKLMNKKLRDTLTKLKIIKLIHGDIKPRNMLLYRGNDRSKGMLLGDLGFAIYNGRKADSAGYHTYVSPHQIINNRPATFNDCDVSGAFSIAFLATGYLSWIALTGNKRNLDKRTMASVLFLKDEFMNYLYAQMENEEKQKLQRDLSPELGDELLLIIRTATVTDNNADYKETIALCNTWHEEEKVTSKL